MSHSNTRRTGSGADYLAGWEELFRLIREGKSFSGRERNCLFLNAGETGFVNASAVSGFDLPDDGRGLAVVDWDRDGRLDVWSSNRTGPRVRLFRNQTQPLGNWAAFQLEGTRTNRDAIGARVSIKTAAGLVHRTLTAGSGYLSQSSKVVHFGLGDAPAIEDLVVRWPGGAFERFKGAQVNRRQRLVEGSGRAQPVPPSEPRDWPQLAASAPVPEPESTRTVLAARLDLPRVPYRTSEGLDGSLEESVGRPLIVNLWASWCQPCIEELGDWTAHEHELLATGADVITLDTDAVQYRAISERRLSRLGWPFRSGVATQQTMEVLEAVNRAVLQTHGALSLPTTLLVDAEHRLVAVYHGKVAAETLLADLTLADDPERVRDAATPFDGRWLAPPAPGAFQQLVRELSERGHEAFAVRRGRTEARPDGEAPELEPPAPGAESHETP